MPLAGKQSNEKFYRDFLPATYQSRRSSLAPPTLISGLFSKVLKKCQKFLKNLGLVETVARFALQQPLQMAPKSTLYLQAWVI